MFLFKKSTWFFDKNELNIKVKLNKSIIFFWWCIKVNTVFPWKVSEETILFWKWKMWKFSYSFRIMAIFCFINWIAAAETIELFTEIWYLPECYMWFPWEQGSQIKKEWWLCSNCAARTVNDVVFKIICSSQILHSCCLQSLYALLHMLNRVKVS